MLYVSFIEIFVKAKDSILDDLADDKDDPTDEEEGRAVGICTACFFAGMGICALLEVLVHKLHERFSPAELHGHELPNTTKQSPAAASLFSSSADAGVVQIEVQSGQATSTATQSATDSAPTAAGGRPDLGSMLDSTTALTSPDSKKKLKQLGVMTALAIALHNFPEGLATFIATVDDPSVGIGLGIAIAVHNIPEGLCVAMPVYYATGSKWQGFWWSVISGVTEPIGGIAGYAALKPVFTDTVFGVVFSMVGGMMVFIVAHELLPSAHRYLPDRTGMVTACVVIGMFVMAISLVLFGL
jgi:ZIP family zinc transporter